MPTGAARFLASVERGDADEVGAALDQDPTLVGLAEKTDPRRAVLTIALERGHRAVCELLLAAGADPGRRDARGRSPMEVAVAAGDLPLVVLLEQAGARDLEERTRLERAIDVARAPGHDELRAWLEARRPPRSA